MKSALDHQNKLFIFTLGTVEGLIDKGFLSGAKMLTPKGLKLYKKLEDSGFEPTEEELVESFEALQQFLENEDQSKELDGLIKRAEEIKDSPEKVLE